MYKILNNNERGISLVDLILLIVLICGIMYIVNYITMPNDTQVGLNSNETTITNTNTDYDSYKFNSNYNNNGNNYNSENNNQNSYNIVTNISNGNPSSSNITNQYKSYFYEQLSDNAKTIYNSVINNIEILKSGQGKIDIDITEGRN